jgi:flagellar protein FlaG
MAVGNVSPDPRSMVVETPEAAALNRPPVSRESTKSEPATNTKQVEPQPTREEVRKVVEDLNSVLSSINKDIQLRIDDDTEQIVTRIVDRRSQEVIKQIPPAELLKIASRLRAVVGLLFDVEA